jgi:small ligand-binding sensory domain FIST
MAAFAASRLVSGSFDEHLVRDTAIALREELAERPTFGLIFVTPDYADKIEDVLELVRVYGHVTTVVGCSGTGLVGRGVEQEEGSGFSLLLVHAPGATAKPYVFTQEMVDDATGPDYWPGELGVNPANVKAWLVFLNPFTVPAVEPWLKQWNQAFPRVPVFGGMAASAQDDNEAWVFCDNQIVPGGVALALEGNIAVQAVVAAGCKPIGEPLTVTQAEKNVLLTLGSRPAYEVLSDAYRELTDTEREQARRHLFAGLAVSEYLEEYKRGDFLVRNIIGADPKSGAVAINALPRVGQTLQYQLRDSRVATDELRRLLQANAARVIPAPYAGPNHDAALVEDFYPGLAMAGLFAGVQLGPVGDRSYAHGYTASLALIGPAR